MSEVVKACVAEFAAVVGALLAVDPDVAPADTSPASGWRLDFEVGVETPSPLALVLGRPGAAEITRRLLAADEAPAAAEVLDGLREIGGQLASALSLRGNATAGTRFVGAGPIETLSGSHPAFVLQSGDLRAELVCWTEPASAVAPAPGNAVSHPLPPPAAAAPSNIEMILHIDLPSAVRCGEPAMTLQTLGGLGVGALIDLGRTPDDPVDVMVNGKIVARGEVVLVAGNYGVRVTEVISASERVKTIGS